MRGKEVDCPGCWRKVTVWESLSASELAALNRAENAKQVDQAKGEFQRLSGMADTFSIIAVILVVAGVTLFAAYLLSSYSGKAVWPIYAGVGAFGFALWFYLVAQIIYIRAALEKLNSK